MRFKNYCIVALGKIDGIREIISKISETQPRYLEQKAVFIGTFSCVMSATELREILDRENKTFFVFEVGDESSAYKIGRDDIHEQLFGYIENGGEEVLNMMSDNLMNEINGVKMSGGTNEHPQKLTLQEELDIALKDEDYIKAAELRDLIKLNNNG